MLKSFVTGDFKKTDFSVGKKYPVNPATQFISGNRTCNDANIDSVYCVCNDVVNVDPEGTYKTWDVGPAAEAVSKYLMHHLVNEKCPQTVNRTVKFSYRIPGPDENFIPFERASITVLLMPSEVTFETKVFRDWDEGEFEVDPYIDPESIEELKIRIHRTCG